MSNEDGYKVAADYTAIDKFTKEVLGSTLTAAEATHWKGLNFSTAYSIKKPQHFECGFFYFGVATIV